MKIILLLLATVFSYSGVGFRLTKEDREYGYFYAIGDLGRERILLIIQQKGDRFLVLAENQRFFNKTSQMPLAADVSLDDGYRVWNRLSAIPRLINNYNLDTVWGDDNLVKSNFYSYHV